ncbi:MAG TPA: hypothetical protein VME40_11425 [Caulobacteraceae bacterium]|nr:hypothetical protein [Caulobacteraceae bacterium]
MRFLAPLAVVALLGLSLGACEDTYYHGGPYAYRYVDGYYDDFYGPFYDGYWGPDDYFYYRAGPSGGYVRDNAHHFVHGAAPGFHAFHARAGHAPRNG